MDLFTILEQTARRYPDCGAVYSGSTRVWTFAELERRALALSAALTERYESGDRIAIFSPNCPEYVELLFGTWAAGMSVTPINGKLHPREVAQIVEDATPRVLFVNPTMAEDVRAALAGLPSDPAVELIEIGSKEYESDLGGTGAVRKFCDPEQLAWLFFTSGTTGRPKGAMLSHRNLLAMSLAHLADMDDPGPETSLLHAAPMSHGSGLYIPAYLSRGARQVIPESRGFSPAEILDLCRAHPDCSAFLAPTMIQRLRREKSRDGRDAGNLRTVIYGGGPMYLREIQESLDVFGDVFVQIYGLGETPMTITGLRRPDFVQRDPRVLASVGYPRSGVEVAVAVEVIG